MILADILLIALIFAAVYHLGTHNLPKTQAAQETGIRLQQKLHKFRMSGVNKTEMEDIQAELARRGSTQIPFFDGSRPDAEVAAELELLLEGTPYVPRDLNEPGEDKDVSKSTFALWLRPNDPQDGDN